jgi:RibD C-terminal domain
MRRIRYAVAISLDGYIAGPKGEADWIILDPEIDFGAFFEQFDTFLLGAGRLRRWDAQGRTGRQARRPSSSRERCGSRTIPG